MTKRQAITDALNHRDNPDVPYHVDFTQQALEQLIVFTGDADINDKVGSFITATDHNGWPEEMPDKPGYFRDEFGTVWNRTVDKDIGALEDPQIIDLESNNYTFPKVNESRIRAELDEMIRFRGDRFALGGIGFSMFERVWSLMGMENVLYNMAVEPEALGELFDRTCDFMSEVVDIVLEYDVDGVFFGDDWGQQHGLIMGPTHWRHFIKPRVAKLYAKVKAKNKFVFQHSCGDCREIMPDLIEIGLDCYQTFQPEIYDIDEMKKLYGNKLTFWGGVSTQRCLPHMTEDGVKAEVVRIIKALRHNGGLIIAPTHAIPFDVPPQNILAMVDVFHNQSNYLT